MGFATVPRLERNRFHALLFLDIPFCLWVVSGLFGGFDDGLACLDDFVAGLKKPDTYQGHLDWLLTCLMYALNCQKT